MNFKNKKGPSKNPGEHYRVHNVFQNKFYWFFISQFSLLKNILQYLAFFRNTQFFFLFSLVNDDMQYQMPC